MEKPLQITFRGLEPSEAVQARIRAKAQELERFAPQIISCHVTVQAPPGHQHRGGSYTVHVDVRVPTGELVVSREHGRDHAHEDVYVAVRDAFNAVVRQLEDYRRRQRGQVKQHEASV